MIEIRRNRIQTFKHSLLPYHGCPYSISQVPSTGASACTLPGIASFGGKLTVGAGGTLASFACYLAPAGTASITTDGTRTRGTATLNPDGTVGAVVSLGSGIYTSPARAIYAATANTGGLCFTGGVAQGTRGLSYNGVVLTVIDTAKVCAWIVWW
jgi:hypothetical protein